jgi:glutaredoxin
MKTTKFGVFFLTSQSGKLESRPVVDSKLGDEKGSSAQMVKLSERPNIKVYGKPGCGLCSAAKEKLSMLGLEYQSLNLAGYTEFHEGWRNDRSCEILAAYRLIDKMPVVEIDGGFHDYPSAMRLLKDRMQRVKEGAAVVAEN